MMEICSQGRGVEVREGITEGAAAVVGGGEKVPEMAVEWWKVQI